MTDGTLGQKVVIQDSQSLARGSSGCSAKPIVGSAGSRGLLALAVINFVRDAERTLATVRFSKLQWVSNSNELI